MKKKNNKTKEGSHAHVRVLFRGSIHRCCGGRLLTFLFLRTTFIYFFSLDRKHVKKYSNTIEFNIPTKKKKKLSNCIHVNNKGSESMEKRAILHPKVRKSFVTTQTSNNRKLPHHIRIDMIGQFRCIHR